MGLIGLAFKIVIVLFLIWAIIASFQAVFTGVLMGTFVLADKLLTPREKKKRKPLLGLRIEHTEKGQIVKSKTI